MYVLSLLYKLGKVFEKQIFLEVCLLFREKSIHYTLKDFFFLSFFLFEVIFIVTYISTVFTEVCFPSLARTRRCLAVKVQKERFTWKKSESENIYQNWHKWLFGIYFKDQLLLQESIIFNVKFRIIEFMCGCGYICI